MDGFPTTKLERRFFKTGSGTRDSSTFQFHRGRRTLKERGFQDPGMETTRHFTATVYVVNDGATALHKHERHDVRVPPGGHVDRDELPHEAGLREVREEMGLNATLLDETGGLSAPTVETLPQPRHHLLYDVTVHDGDVAHQHVDLIYFATVPSRAVEPHPEETDPDAWGWYAPPDLRSSDLDDDVVELGLEAIRAAE